MNNKQYLDLVCSLNCIVCGRQAEPHHPKSFGCGGSQKSSDFLAIPLCRGCDVSHHDEIHKHYNIKGKDEADLLAETIQAVVQKLNNDRIPF